MFHFNNAAIKREKDEEKNQKKTNLNHQLHNFHIITYCAHFVHITYNNNICIILKYLPKFILKFQRNNFAKHFLYLRCNGYILAVFLFSIYISILYNVHLLYLYTFSLFPYSIFFFSFCTMVNIMGGVTVFCIYTFLFIFIQIGTYIEMDTYNINI